MTLIIYGDFNCPYSYLASQRADRLIRAGAARIEWRAIEHDPELARTGTSSAATRFSWEKELAEVATQALPGEDVPAAPPALTSNTHAAVAAYAEAVDDGIADELRRRLFAAIWVQGQHLSSASEVRRLATGLMWQPENIAWRLASPDIPGQLDHDPDLERLVRRSGGTIAGDGNPLTTAGWRRVRQWRENWLALPSQVIPTVTGPGQVAWAGTDALRHLAGQVAAPGFARLQPARAGALTRRRPAA